jgi:hypothetical protein
MVLAVVDAFELHAESKFSDEVERQPRQPLTHVNPLGILFQSLHEEIGVSLQRRFLTRDRPL